MHKGREPGVTRSHTKKRVMRETRFQGGGGGGQGYGVLRGVSVVEESMEAAMLKGEGS